jgi:hypothetical protein
MRTAARSQSWQIVCETLSQEKKRKSPSQKGLVEWLKVQALNLSPYTLPPKKRSRVMAQVV